MREHFDTRGINAYLDTPGGLTLSALHGSRAAAADALARQESADRAWRRQQAVVRAERYPDRYPSVDDAMADIPDPAGAGGAWFTGSTDEVVAAMRWINPACGARNLGGEPEDGAVDGFVLPPGRGLEPADTRAPWDRD